MTRQELEQKYDQLFQKWNGKKCDYDGYYGAQCFDLIQEWNRTFLGGAFIGGNYAYQIYGQQSNLYTSIPNTPDYVPLKGDIIVWANGYNGVGGHTGVATGKGDVNTFDCFEQNDPTYSACHVKNYNYLYVIGGLRYKTQSINWDMKVDQVRNIINGGGTSENKINDIKKIVNS